jgi:putative hydrolase of the HAD superfamily
MGIQPSEIRNIIFDLGGVLLNINPLLSLLEFERLSGISREELTKRLAKEHIFEKIDTGSLDPSQFRSELCRIMNHTASDAEIDHAWNILLLDFPAPRLELLQQLGKNYRVFLLSNTNIIHFRKYTQDFYDTFGMPLTSLFEKVFLSYEIGIHKPDAGIYQYVLQNAGLVPSECVFIDDSLPNIAAAAAGGIAGIHITPDYDVTAYFDNGWLRSNMLPAIV